ncbi:MAG: FAD-binding oxidoreductase [Pseudomonadales bacterium]|nr:FAD-binding oxidoreductase [Pseudomonadales bacterium]
MPDLTFNSGTFSLREHESVLDCLLRNQQIIPYACKAGMCQACLVKAVDCEAPENAKKWIKQTLQARGYALACQWVPDTDVEVSLPSVEEFAVAVRIKSLDLLNHRVMRLVLDVREGDRMFQYYPGQYLTLTNQDGISRSYSIANNYEQDHVIELHIGQTPRGLFSSWLFTKARPGDVLHIRGPAGDCFYTQQEQDDYPIVLAGTGTGLAPLYGIIHEALRQRHQGPISLFHGGRTVQDLYYCAELSKLAEQYPQFHYFPSCLDAADSIPDELSGKLETGMLDAVLDRHLDTATIAQTRVFLCGAPELVHALRKKIFLKGAKSGHIFCDPFLERSIPGSIPEQVGR